MSKLVTSITIEYGYYPIIGKMINYAVVICVITENILEQYRGSTFNPLDESLGRPKATVHSHHIGSLYLATF